MESEYVIRTACSNDIAEIEALSNSDTTRCFGEKLETPVSQLFKEYQTHRLVVYHSNNPEHLLAYCHFGIHPGIPVLANDLWVDWLQRRFCVNLPLTLMNTIFMNYCIYEEAHDKILKLVLMEAFYREHKVNFLIIVRPPKYSSKEYELLDKYGRVYYPIDFDTYSRRNLTTIIVITRKELMPMLIFRKALPEDNDDVVEMIDVEEPKMRVEHGDYYIAEMLLGTSGKLDKDKIIVTEDSKGGGSTGMMWLTEKVNIEELIRNYDLTSMGNLVSCTPDAPHNTQRLEVCSTAQSGLPSIKVRNIRLSKRRGVSLNPAAEKFKLSELERVYTIFRHISDELKSARNYLSKQLEILPVTYDAGHRRSSIKSKQHHGLQSACKAFILKNFILHPSLRIEYTFYYLSAMFSAYPEYDFCLVPIQPGSIYSLSMWALLQFFTRVPHRPNSTMSEEIFVAHRSSIYTELAVYPLEQKDVSDIIGTFQNYVPCQTSTETLTQTQLSITDDDNNVVPLLQQIINDVLENEKPEFSIWIVRCGQVGREKSTTIGFVVMRPFSNYEGIYKQFWLPYDENYLTFDRGEIVMLRLHPYFHMWSDEILRTVSLKCGFRELYYFQPFTDFVLPNDLAFKMMPVEPRRMKRNWFNELSTEKSLRRQSTSVPLPPIDCVHDNFHLYRHNLCPSKYIGNQNPLVIVGFSDTCKALLRLMVFSWNTPDFRNVNISNCLSYLDITVIVNYGEIEAEYERNLHCAHCSSPSDCYLSNGNSSPFVMDATQRLDLRKWIHFVPGNVEHIDCKEKTVHLDNKCQIRYTKLLLLCDTMYGLPAHLQAKAPNGEAPYNYAHINRRLDKIVLYYKIIQLSDSTLSKKRIIIYGYTLEVYECIDFLLKHGCQPHDIMYVQPLKIQAPEYFNIPTLDRNIDDILKRMIADLGIHIYESTSFEDYSLYESAYFIKTVNFRSYPHNELVSLECNLFINFLENYLPASTEQVLNQSQIHVKDRKILVDENFCTNDPDVYAAGKNVSIVGRIFYQYTYTNQLEMAEKLINILQLTQEPRRKDERFSKPAYFQALLPMGHRIVKITTPKRYLLAKLDNSYCHVMTTYDKGDFCRIRVATNNMIEEITCITQNLQKPLYFLEYFCGKHDLLLNNLRDRYRLGLIENFISFFEQPWTEYIMHDRFNEMQLLNRETLISLINKKQSVFKALAMDEEDFDVACRVFVQVNLLRFLRTYRREFINKFAVPKEGMGEHYDR